MFAVATVNEDPRPPSHTTISSIYVEPFRLLYEAIYHDLGDIGTPSPRDLPPVAMVMEACGRTYRMYRLRHLRYYTCITRNTEHDLLRLIASRYPQREILNALTEVPPTSFMIVVSRFFGDPGWFLRNRADACLSLYEHATDPIDTEGALGMLFDWMEGADSIEISHGTGILGPLRWKLERLLCNDLARTDSVTSFKTFPAAIEQIGVEDVRMTLHQVIDEIVRPTPAPDEFYALAYRSLEDLYTLAAAGEFTPEMMDMLVSTRIYDLGAVGIQRFIEYAAVQLAHTDELHQLLRYYAASLTHPGADPFSATRSILLAALEYLDFALAVPLATLAELNRLDADRLVKLLSDADLDVERQLLDVMLMKNVTFTQLQAHAVFLRSLDPVDVDALEDLLGFPLPFSTDIDLQGTTQPTVSLADIQHMAKQYQLSPSAFATLCISGFSLAQIKDLCTVG